MLLFPNTVTEPIFFTAGRARNCSLPKRWLTFGTSLTGKTILRDDFAADDEAKNSQQINTFIQAGFKRPAFFARHEKFTEILFNSKLHYIILEQDNVVKQSRNII